MANEWDHYVLLLKHGAIKLSYHDDELNWFKNQAWES